MCGNVDLNKFLDHSQSPTSPCLGPAECAERLSKHTCCSPSTLSHYPSPPDMYMIVCVTTFKSTPTLQPPSPPTHPNPFHPPRPHPPTLSERSSVISSALFCQPTPVYRPSRNFYKPLVSDDWLDIIIFQLCLILLACYASFDLTFCPLRGSAGRAEPFKKKIKYIYIYIYIYICITYAHIYI